MGYLRVRRSVKLGSGVKLNLNKRSLGMTVGGRGAHYSVNTRGQRTTTVGLPGSGISYIDRSNTQRRTTRSGRSPTRTGTPPPAVPAASPPHPGIFAHHSERAFCAAIQNLTAGDQETALAKFQEADRSDTHQRPLSPALMAGILIAQLGRPAEAIPYLERVTSSEKQLPDALMTKYGAALSTNLLVEQQISIPIQVGSLLASILLAWCYRDTNRLDDAIGVMQQLYEHAPSPATMVLLCNLYAHAEDWDEIVHLTAGMQNRDDITLLLRLQQAQALAEQGVPDAAMEAYRDALKSKRRDEELLKRARYERAKLYVASGKKAMAKRDLGRLYADDPNYRDVGTLLHDLA